MKVQGDQSSGNMKVQHFHNCLQHSYPCYIKHATHIQYCQCYQYITIVRAYCTQMLTII